MKPPTSSKERLHKDQLEFVVADVLNHLKGIDFIRDARICVVGALAVEKHVHVGRKIEEINLLVDIDDAPAALSRLKQTLLCMPDTSFYQRLGFLYYDSGDGYSVKIVFCAVSIYPYDLDTPQLKDVGDGFVPYISAKDLIVFKILVCGTRTLDRRNEKDVQDAEDALKLVKKQFEYGPLRFTDNQKKHVSVKGGIEAVCENDSERSVNWWEGILGLSHEQRQKRRT